MNEQQNAKVKIAAVDRVPQILARNCPEELTEEVLTGAGIAPSLSPDGTLTCSGLCRFVGSE